LNDSCPRNLSLAVRAAVRPLYLGSGQPVAIELLRLPAAVWTPGQRQLPVDANGDSRPVADVRAKRADRLLRSGCCLSPPRHGCRVSAT